MQNYWGKKFSFCKEGFAFLLCFINTQKWPSSELQVCPDLMHLRSKSTFQILGFFYTSVQILLPRGCWAFHSGQCFGFSIKKKNALQKKLEPASWNQKLFNSLKFHMQKCYAKLWNTKRKGHFRTSVLFPEELGVTCRFHLFCPGPL